MKTCSCGSIIPRSVVIDGKPRNLKNRTKCLTCLPFGVSHRKKTTNEHRSRKAKDSKAHYYKYKATHGIDAVRMRRESKKRAIVLALGGACQLCGYNKTVRNLAFHHLVEKDKEMGLCTRTFQLSWDRILPEIQKCILVCHNCHGEIHDNMVDQERIAVLYEITKAAISKFMVSQDLSK